jgi:hypothetical protein
LKLQAVTKLYSPVRRRPLAALRFWGKILRVRFLLIDPVHSRTPRAEDQVMSFVLWKILRLLPKPILFILMFFVLGAVARA